MYLLHGKEERRNKRKKDLENYQQFLTRLLKGMNGLFGWESGSGSGNGLISPYDLNYDSGNRGII